MNEQRQRGRISEEQNREDEQRKRIQGNRKNRGREEWNIGKADEQRKRGGLGNNKLTLPIPLFLAGPYSLSLPRIVGNWSRGVAESTRNRRGIEEALVWISEYLNRLAIRYLEIIRLSRNIITKPSSLKSTNQENTRYPLVHGKLVLNPIISPSLIPEDSVTASLKIA